MDFLQRSEPWSHGARFPLTEEIEMGEVLTAIATVLNSLSILFILCSKK